MVYKRVRLMSFTLVEPTINCLVSNSEFLLFKYIFIRKSRIRTLDLAPLPRAVFCVVYGDCTLLCPFLCAPPHLYHRLCSSRSFSFRIWIETFDVNEIMMSINQSYPNMDVLIRAPSQWLSVLRLVLSWSFSLTQISVSYLI